MPYTENKHAKPKKIYKYVSFDVAKLIIQDRMLKFSPPSSFNDPYDCDVDLLDFKFDGVIDDSVKREMDALQEIFKKQIALNNESNQFWEKAYKQGQLAKIKSTKISCFSLVNDDLLLWAHYSDKHKGVCLEFNNLVDRRFIELADDDQVTEGEVDYESKGKINYIAENRWFSIYKLFFSKGEQWRHEKEYRFILLNQEPELHAFNPFFLSSIYFGIKVVPSEKSEIMHLCADKGLGHVDFFEGRKDNRKIAFSHLPECL